MKAIVKIETFTVKSCIPNITSGNQDRKKLCNIYKIAICVNFNPKQDRFVELFEIFLMQFSDAIHTDDEEINVKAY